MEVLTARESKRAALVLAPDETTMLKELAASRKAPAREVERAKVLLGYAGGKSITQLPGRVRQLAAHLAGKGLLALIR
jgi:hypothetical protein